MKKSRIAGFDMGAKYVAWALLEGDSDGYCLSRHGLLYPPEIGNTSDFGQSLPLWSSFFDLFLSLDLQPDFYGIERYTHRPSGGGQSSEAINLRIPGMMGQNAILIRNTDWKTWFHRHVSDAGTEDYFRLTTPHESDAAGIAAYTAYVCVPRRLESISRLRLEAVSQPHTEKPPAHRRNQGKRQ